MKDNEAVGKVFSAMNLETLQQNIAEVYRINKDVNAPLMVKFNNYEAKKQVQERIRSIKGIRVNECGLKGNNKNIYFNEDLTQYNQLLFKRTRGLKKTK